MEKQWKKKSRGKYITKIAPQFCFTSITERKRNFTGHSPLEPSMNKNTEVCILKQKPLHCFHPQHDHQCTFPPPYSEPPGHSIMGYKPLPYGHGLSLEGGVMLGRGVYIWLAGHISEENEEKEQEESVYPLSLYFSLSLISLLVSWSKIHIFQELAAPHYDCKLRVNFHCWLRLGLQTSTVSPPILALRLSKQRLLPTWRSFELDSICSHFCLLSFSRQPCSLMRDPAVLSTTVKHRSMCFTDLSLVRAHSWFPPALWHS